jgi:hypothetical protein
VLSASTANCARLARVSMPKRNNVQNVKLIANGRISALAGINNPFFGGRRGRKTDGGRGCSAGDHAHLRPSGIPK